ncbi:MAG: membrane protein insertase YidC [Treponema sp.]|jgi:YidC/Oxa1 family membrane protein insertase|nr:membrane protein insertase YidC [Treponema sp.]
MEKRTLLAIVLSIAVIIGFYLVQGIFFPQKQPAGAAGSAPSVGPPVEASPASGSSAAAVVRVVPADDGTGDQEEGITIETELLQVTFSNRGGDIVSYQLKERQDQRVEMVLPGLEEPRAFTIALGKAAQAPLTDYFQARRLSSEAGEVVEFSRKFQLLPPEQDALGQEPAQGGGVLLTKRYTFKPTEYMFELAVSLEADPAGPALNFSGAAYTLGFGPQIGPAFTKLDQRSDYRQYYTFMNGKRREEKVKENAPAVIGERVLWAAIAGKYFTFIAVPDATQYELTFSAKPEPGLPSASRFYMTRPAAAPGGRIADIYRFYLGPKNQSALAVYDTGNNSFNIRNMDFVKVANTSGILAPLETALKWFLSLFYRIIPNYGIAIILLTLLVRAILFPLTKKSSESTLRMQALAPKIKEIQEKYKDNPSQMNAKMAELYKQEGYNPLTGCFPLLIQFPIFFAMYNLFNNHFDLRGAPFIPGWIPDLSVPESIFSFAPSQIPLLGWTDIRLLPFIYVGSQLLSGMITQTPDQKHNAQMKMMLYVMPLIFFFILYNVPSGLLLYWIMTNILSLVQQLIINRYRKHSPPAPAITGSKPIIAPRKKRKS